MIENTFHEEDPFLLPWTVKLNGLEINSSNFAINRFIEKVYPGFLNKAKRMSTLHILVKKLYEDKFLGG